MDSRNTQLYIRRAADFYAGMDFTRDDEALRATSALLAIHSAIAYSDALRTGLGDEVLYADNHRQALDAMRSLVRARRLDDIGLGHFEYLISMKTFVAYSAQRLDRERASLIAVRAERFANWVNRIAKSSGIQGWKSDDN